MINLILYFLLFDSSISIFFDKDQFNIFDMRRQSFPHDKEWSFNPPPLPSQFSLPPSISPPIHQQFYCSATNLGPIFSEPRSYLLKPIFGCLSHTLISSHDIMYSFIQRNLVSHEKADQSELLSGDTYRRVPNNWSLSKQSSTKILASQTLKLIFFNRAKKNSFQKYYITQYFKYYEHSNKNYLRFL